MASQSVVEVPARELSRNAMHSNTGGPCGEYHVEQHAPQQSAVAASTDMSAPSCAQEVPDVDLHDHNHASDHHEHDHDDILMAEVALADDDGYLKDALLYWADGHGDDDDHHRVDGARVTLPVEGTDNDEYSGLPCFPPLTEGELGGTPGVDAATSANCANPGANTLTLFENGLMKSVHMELQENAKVSVLNDPVDRSNSSTVERKVPGKDPFAFENHRYPVAPSGQEHDHENTTRPSTAVKPPVSAQQIAEKFMAPSVEADSTDSSKPKASSQSSHTGESRAKNTNTANANPEQASDEATTSNLGEKFLRNPQRASAAINYNSAGELVRQASFAKDALNSNTEAASSSSLSRADELKSTPANAGGKDFVSKGKHQGARKSAYNDPGTEWRRDKDDTRPEGTVQQDSTVSDVSGASSGHEAEHAQKQAQSFHQARGQENQNVRRSEVRRQDQGLEHRSNRSQSPVKKQEHGHQYHHQEQHHRAQHGKQGHHQHSSHQPHLVSKSQAPQGQQQLHHPTPQQPHHHAQQAQGYPPNQPYPPQQTQPFSQQSQTQHRSSPQHAPASPPYGHPNAAPAYHPHYVPYYPYGRPPPVQVPMPSPPHAPTTHPSPNGSPSPVGSPSASPPPAVPGTNAMPQHGGLHRGSPTGMTSRSSPTLAAAGPPPPTAPVGHAYQSRSSPHASPVSTGPPPPHAQPQAPSPPPQQVQQPHAPHQPYTAVHSSPPNGPQQPPQQAQPYGVSHGTMPRSWNGPQPTNHHGPMPNSIREATMKKNQFGFGGNHVVPSVPMPPMPLVQHQQRQQQPPKQQAARKETKRGKRASQTVSQPRAPPAPAMKTPVVTSTPNVPASVTNSAAYERKKQKAKDGRVKLNEAIEKLSVSISLAGTQSKRRLENNPDLLSSATCQSMKECEKAAMLAKKYDRPSFVGSAALLVQALNDQCEALIKELKELKSRSGSEQYSAPQTNICGKRVRPGDSQIPTKRQKTASGSTSEVVPTSSAVIRHVEHSRVMSHVDHFSMLVAQGPVLKVLASFLDPASLVRCTRVSRYWKNISEFQCDDVWENVCVQRFGAEKAALWANRVASNSQVNEGPTHKRKLELYKEMSAANVSPQSSLEGNLKLGEAKVDGVSAWASMMARSNGETLRSVKMSRDHRKNPSHQHFGEFSSLPMVDMRIVVQNTGAEQNVIVPDQPISIDASTRRREEELVEIASDDRFLKRITKLDGSALDCDTQTTEGNDELFQLKLFDSVMLQVHIHARGCPTTARFQKKANFTKLLVSLNETTFPLVIPFSKQDETTEGATLVKQT